MQVISAIIKNMKITSVTLENFRNYAARRFEFSDGTNVICGKNGVGKTNLLESVYLCGVGRSPRTSKEKELIRYDSDGARVTVTLAKKFRDKKIDLVWDERARKRIFIDGVPISRTGELLGVLAVVYFSPDELMMIKGAPEERRHFLDVGLCQRSKAYFYTLQRYQRILKQRNQQLKERDNAGDLRALLDIWDIQLAKEGAKIVTDRRAFLELLAAPAAEAHSVMSEGAEELTLVYDTSLSGVTEAELTDELLTCLKRDRDKDMRLQFTSTGPHRDDMGVFINGKDARKFASQGQQRTAALSLKVGEVKLFEAETGEKPVLLLDDVLSELDEGRRRRMLSLVAGVQTLITCTEYDGDEPNLLIKIE